MGRREVTKIKNINVFIINSAAPYRMQLLFNNVIVVHYEHDAVAYINQTEWHKQIFLSLGKWEGNLQRECFLTL